MTKENQTEYWDVDDLGFNGELTQEDANKLAEMGYTLEDIRNLEDEEINNLLMSEN